MSEKKVRFISYDGKYPCLCYGDLVLIIEGKKVVLPNCLSSGGNVWFDDNWDEHVEEGAWSVDVPEEYMKYKKEITEVVNESVPWGCCGGCV